MRKLALLLLLIASPVFAEFTAVYTPPKTQAEVAIASGLQNSQTLEKLTAILNRVVSVQPTITIVAGSCGAANAFYNSQKKAIVLCYELLLDNATRLIKNVGNKLTQQQLREVLDAEMVFVLLHEVGHALIDEFQLPVLGREEDAADKFAAFVLLNSNGEKFLREATLFFYFNKPSLLTHLLKGSALYSDEHGLAQQRLANLVCWGFGKNPPAFAQMASNIKVSANRLNRCADEYSKLNRDIRALLADRLTIDQIGVARSPPSQARQSMVEDATGLAQRHMCLACHGVDNSGIGPAFRDVARKYKGSDSEQLLMTRVRYGSAGIWGQVPAPPQSVVPEEDLKKVVQWITSLPF